MKRHVRRGESSADKKYVLTDKQRIVRGTIVTQIKAIRSFGNVKAGDLGGYVQGEHNLSHNGNSWLYNDAVAMENSFVDGDAKVGDKAIIYEEANISHSAIVEGRARVCGKSRVCNFSRVLQDAYVNGSSWIKGRAVVKDNAWIYSGIVSGSSVIGEKAVIQNRVVVKNATIINDGVISDKNDYIVIGPIGHGFFTFYRNKYNDISVAYGNKYYGDIESFKNDVECDEEKMVFTISYVRNVLRCPGNNIEFPMEYKIG